MTRIENRDAADGPSPGVIGLAVVRCAPGFGQHAVDELPDLAQIERLGEIRRAGPLEELALFAATKIRPDTSRTPKASRRSRRPAGRGREKDRAVV
jgi:hypothetical protein